jgi:Mg2+-importing ATPase
MRLRFLPQQELFARLFSSRNGLTGEEAQRRLEDGGKNVITVGRKNTALHRLREAVINPFNLILILIAVITYFTDVVASSKPDYLTVCIILGLVAVSSAVAFIQGQRSNTAGRSSRI